MDELFIGVALILLVTIFVALYRAIIGPTPADRIIAINVIGTKAVIVMVLISFAFDQAFFLDVGLVYALISFLATVGMAKYLEKGRLD